MRAIISLSRLTKVHYLVAALDSVLKPLPQLAQAVSSTLFISAVPIFLIYGANSLLVQNQHQMEHVTQYLISFAVGGLLGDVFFHTLPHMQEAGHSHGHSHDHSHSPSGSHSHHSHDTLNNFLIIVGIVSFFLLEKLTHEYLGGGHDHSHHGHQHGPK